MLQRQQPIPPIKRKPAYPSGLVLRECPPHDYPITKVALGLAAQESARSCCPRGKRS